MSDATLTLEEIEPASHAASGNLGTLPIDSIIVSPEQKREMGDLAGLAASIKRNGILTALTVRQTPTGFTLVAGGRRLEAAKMAGLTEVPVLVKTDVEDEGVDVMRLVENVQRLNLNPIEEAKGFQALAETYGLTQQSIARRTGRSALHVGNRIRLLSLVPQIQQMVGRPDGLTIGEAEQIAKLPADRQLGAVAQVQEGKDVETVVRTILSNDQGAAWAQETAQRLVSEGKDVFSGELGKDGFAISREEPEPGKLYWPQDRPDDMFSYLVLPDGTVERVATDVEDFADDDDEQVRESVQELLQHRQIAAGEVGTMDKPLEPATLDEAAKLRAKAERATVRALRRRDEEREAHLNKRGRSGAAYSKFGPFVLRALLEQVPASVKDAAFARARVERGQREDGFGEEWKVEDFVNQATGDGWFKLAYMVALQTYENIIDGAVRTKGAPFTGQDQERVLRYLEHLGTTGYPGSSEEFALVGEQHDDPAEGGSDETDDEADNGQ